MRTQAIGHTFVSANSVCGSPMKRLQRKCSCGSESSQSGECEQCRSKRTSLSRQAGQSGFGTQHDQFAPPIVQNVLGSGGQPLDPAIRAFMEPRFGHDFGRVRVHTNTKAADSARAVSADAYTVGRDVVFGAGKFAPESSEGKRLLAHELTHVVQQDSATAPANEQISIVPVHHSSEREAEDRAEKIGSQRLPPPTHRAGPNVARQPAQRAQTQRNPFVKNVHYDRSDFGQRFDAEVSTSPRVATLIMGLDFVPAGWSPHEDPLPKLPAFKTRLKQVIENTWSYRYALHSVCNGPADKFEARVRVDLGASNPHSTIYFHPDTPGGRSGAGDGQAALQESDVFAKETSRYFQTKKGKPPEQRTFMHITAAHEFGHLMGLSHPHCPGNADQCYGVTTEEAMDVMGMGSYVSRKDYAPFERIMERFGQDTLPATCNKWKLVEPG
jgi:Domain of unknown function (DUF4157)